jgi:hypothetical protein
MPMLERAGLCPTRALLVPPVPGDLRRAPSQVLKVFARGLYFLCKCGAQSDQGFMDEIHAHGRHHKNFPHFPVSPLRSGLIMLGWKFSD